MTATYETLTPSGKGLRITDRRITDFSPTEVRALLAKYHWLSFKNHPVTVEEMIEYLPQYGTLTENDRRVGPVLKIDASKKDEGEVLLGQGFLPLHRDGVLMGYNIELVAICCAQYENVVNGGRTFIADIENGCKQVPSEILDVIRDKGIEGRPVDRYYLSSSDKWHWIPGFTELDGQEWLSIGFPYRKDEKPSWLLRIPGVEDERTAAMFETLSSVLMSEQFCYYHQWEEGDVLLLDNRKVLHGREAFTGGPRRLANLQVLAS
jgi:(5R)-carbapenem-3-carboxylate synthase